MLNVIGSGACTLTQCLLLINHGVITFLDIANCQCIDSSSEKGYVRLMSN